MGAEHHSLFQLGPDTTPYRKLTSDGVRTEKALGREILVVEPSALSPARRAGDDRHQPPAAPGPSAQLANILDDPTTSTTTSSPTIS